MLTINRPENRITCEEILERFVLLIHKTGTGPLDCWEFAETNSYGYGTFTPPGLSEWGAHRFAYYVFVAAIPRGLFVLHRCDNPPCVRPSHLFLGTSADNMRDVVRKRRSLFGERNPHASLTAEQVREIRIRSAAGESQSSIARRFGVQYRAIAKIQHGERWAQVE